MNQAPVVKFLLVDDLDENLVALKALLERPSLELLCARSGREALELLLNHDVALAIVDVQMPEMDGFELAELMRGTARTRHVPIIFVTAGAHDNDRVFQGYDAGAVDFLFKPLNPHVLRSKAEVFLRLEQQRRELEHTLRLNETFVAAVGHDLRNPLNAVLMGLELLLAKAADPHQREVAERVRSSGRRMSRMIDDLFDLAHARLGGGMPIDPHPAHLDDIARRATSELVAANPDREITLKKHGRVDGAWDEGRIAQVFSNLVGNALRHGAKGRPVLLELDGDDDRVTARIENEGEIADEVRTTLFDPFARGRMRGRVEGLGLGLFIVQQILTAHGGHIDATSSHGRTCFTFELPRIVASPAAAPSPRSSRS